jgi:alpha-glucosidase
MPTPSLFGQKTHPLNFDYADRMIPTETGLRVSGHSFTADIHCHEITPFCTRLNFDNGVVGDKRNHSDAILEDYRGGRLIPPCLQQDQALFDTACSRITVGAARLTLRMAAGTVLATTGDGFGGNGETFILNFDIGAATACYGFGERTKRFNKMGDSLECWTVDVVAVFPHTHDRDDYDPTYVAIPLAIVKVNAAYIGLYFDNPGRTLLDVGKTRAGQLMYQSRRGNTHLYIIAGPGLRQVVRHFTALTGRAAVPPLWSLGYHQCRWSYESETEIRALKVRFEQHDIPVSALWYDIDYMDGFRLFTWDKQRFPAPAALNEELKEAGIHSVAIIDPGVKRELGYTLYDSGVQGQVFCKTASGRDYVGRVWPGDTVFPDFTQAATRDWWAERLADFLRDSALDGVWLDMNDPATGFSDPDDMRFAGGTVAHDRYHNQYAHFMAMASRQAFARHAPDARPFLLTRSACAGTQRYSALWTGDNVSEWRHLRMAIPCTLNLGLSGFAYSGPDVGGFLGHTTAELLVRWYQACFLFPFFRNHSARHSKPQEPWQFGEPCLSAVRHAITTRYRLLPYLYACAFQHFLSGDPILRPLLYEYDEPEFESLDDQYLVGDALLVAPILTAAGTGHDIIEQGVGRQCRPVTLPPGRWYDLNRGEWLNGGRTLRYAAALDEIPLFARDGAIIPYYNGPLRNGVMDLGQMELHVFSDGRTAARDIYFIDDRQTQDYARGRFNTVAFTALLDADTWIVTLDENGHYPLATVAFTPVFYGCPDTAKQLTVIDNGKRRTHALQPASRPWIGRWLPVLA